MNSDYPVGKRGASITPSARRGIHSYIDPVLNSNSMVRYGLNKSNRSDRSNNLSSTNEQGVDEVDNVMSKFRHASPISIRKKNIIRSNSYSPDEDDSESNLDDNSDADEINCSANLTEDDNHYNSINSSAQSSSLQKSTYNRKLSITSRNDTQHQSNSKFVMKAFGLSLIIGLAGLAWNGVITTSSREDIFPQIGNDNIILFENNMKSLQEKYNIDDKSILQLKTGISTIFSRMDTGSFIFLYNDKHKHFNHVKFEEFVDEVAHTSAIYLRNDISSVQHTVVTSSNLDMQEHSELIEKYRNDVGKSGVMLVKEMDAVPSDLAMAFHYYCDEYNPLVKRSALFFTLNLANCFSISEQKPNHDFIEKCLTRKWTTLSPENLRPLLTRVVNVIIDVSSVF